MCWYSYTRPKMKLATEDIPVEKILKVSGLKICSPLFKDTEWKLNEKKATKLDDPIPLNSSFKYHVDQGFHSCREIILIPEPSIPFTSSSTWINGKNILFSRDNDEYVFEAIIPHGSRYYVNDEGDYVSDQLVILRKKTIKML